MSAAVTLCFHVEAGRSAASRGALFDDSRTLSRLIGRPTTPVTTLIAAARRG